MACVTWVCLCGTSAQMGLSKWQPQTLSAPLPAIIIIQEG